MRSSRARRNLHFPLGSAVLVLALAGVPAGARAAASVGETMELSGRDLNGRGFNLAAMRGKIVVVNFWATWCTPCRAEMPMLNAIYLRHRKDGVILIGIAEDRSRDREAVAAAAARLHYPAAMLGDLDENGFGRPRVLPVTYVVDAGGIVRAVLQPREQPLSDDDLERAVIPLLKMSHPQ